ncbi:MAG: tRNA pseudouridine(54/55) synthase Pus10 [Candidatus Micrarchaeota archaeon]
MHSSDFEFDGQFSDQLIGQLAVLIRERIGEFEIKSFSLGCSYPYTVTDDEKQLLKKEFQFALVKTLEKSLGITAEFDRPDCVITLDFNSRLIAFWVASAYFSGRYNKFSREIAQTVFYCPKCKGKGCLHCKGTGKLGLETVEELIGNAAKPMFDASGFAFHGAGREDVNVRMLGSGRPFVMEIKEPKIRTVDLKKISQTVNDFAAEKIKIFDLAWSDSKSVGTLKEERRQKKYLAVISCANEINPEKLEKLSGKTFEVEQQTPLRVARRRADIIRKRTVKVESIKSVSKTEFEIVLLTDAGLYVKEFVSGEQGRSIPSLSSLLENSCGCKQLDVLEILEPKPKD